MADATRASVPGRELGVLGRGDVPVAIAALSAPVRRRAARGRWSPAPPGVTARTRPSASRSRSRAHAIVASAIWMALVTWSGPPPDGPTPHPEGSHAVRRAGGDDPH